MTTPQKKVCPKCNQFMLLKPIRNERFLKQWECPWCDHIEPYQIEKPANMDRFQGHDDFSRTLGVRGKCTSKNIDLAEDDSWKCLDVRASNEVRSSPTRMNEFNMYLRLYGHVAVCKFCKDFRKSEDPSPVKVEPEPTQTTPEQVPQVINKKHDDRFASLDFEDV